MLFGLPIWAWQFGVALLRVAGLTSWASALSARLALALIQAVKSVKTYHDNNDFPHPFPGLTNESNINKKTA